MGKIAKHGNEDHYLAKYVDLIAGTMVVIDRDTKEKNPTPVEGDELSNGRVITSEDVAEFDRIVKKGTKHLMLRPCQDSGEEFWVATSDMHQTVFAPAVRKAKKKDRAKDRRKNRSSALKDENADLKAKLAELEGEKATATA